MLSVSSLESMYRATGGVQATASWFNGAGTAWGHVEDGNVRFSEDGQTEIIARRRTFRCATARLVSDPVNLDSTLTIGSTEYVVVDHQRTDDGLETVIELGDA